MNTDSYYGYINFVLLLQVWISSYGTNCKMYFPYHLESHSSKQLQLEVWDQNPVYHSDVHSVARATSTRTHCHGTWGLSVARNLSFSARSARILPNIEVICRRIWLASTRLTYSTAIVTYTSDIKCSEFQYFQCSC